jgi:2-polyprenyl-3-methyl-5-hydroxy-6-metoxy-1,4-benzoquinol methylase
MSLPETDTPVRIVSSRVRRPSLPQALAIKMERLLWGRRAEQWDQEGSAALAPVVAAVLEECGARPGMVAVDLGCGSGQVTLPLARECSHVLAVDLSEGAIELLKERAEQQGVGNIDALAQPIELFDLALESVDLVVTNYALHHLRDRDKSALVQHSFEWIRPGGRLVIGDMMFGRGVSREDREVITPKIRSLAKRGASGWWRILKNAWRFTLRLQEKPLPASAWETLVQEAGFSQVHLRRVLAEACVLSARKPEPNSQPEAAE